MTTTRLSQEIQAFKMERLASWIGIVSAPFLFIIGAFIFGQYVFTFIKEYILICTLSFVLYWIISKARLLKKYVAGIEPIVLKEIDPWLATLNISYPSLKKQKKHAIYIIFMPVFLFSLLFFTSLIYPVPFVKEFFVLSIICEILLVGLLKLKQFEYYINQLTIVYQEIVKSSGEGIEQLKLININTKKATLISCVLGMVLFLVSHLLLRDIKTLPLLLIILSFCSLFILGKSLYDAYGGFYKALSQIDELRSKIG